MKLLNVEIMKQLESAADAGGYTFEKMMTKAGQNLAHVVHERYYTGDQNHALGLVGAGNNGGDTLVALSMLQESGWTCSAVLLKPASQPNVLIEEYRKVGGKLLELGDEGNSWLINEIDQARVILDGVFGTGFKLPIRSPYKEILELVGKKSSGKMIVAVDCPSGIDCISGMASPETLKADLTVCMEAVKEGLLKFPAFNYCGEIVTVDLGIPPKHKKDVKGDDIVIDSQFVKKSLPTRKSDAHKGDFGHVIVCGGSVNYVGAPVLAGKSAYRVGAGLVECAVPERIYEAAAAASLESTWLLLEDVDGVIAESASSTLISRLKDADCLLIGPGIGREDTTLRFFNRSIFESFTNTQSASIGFVPKNIPMKSDIQSRLPPLVIDADALRLLSKTTDWFKRLKALAVLTPHPGEMACLTGLTVDEIQNDRLSIARQFATKWGQVVVLKGALTVVASPEGRIAVLPFADSMLAKAGTGDVLAGMIAGLIAQGVPLFDAASAGVWIHAHAGVLAAQKLGSSISLLASEMPDAIPGVFNSL
ncbi:MAG: hypothetical protein C0401_10015 [Anaerolinea sp.]|nr:hypothetical protein [Anaerolinea sp.]